jgi:hypothetical protein
MNLQVIDHHTIDIDLLVGGPVLDVGAYGWGFAKELASKGCRVIALDPSPDIVDPQLKGVTYFRFGLVGVGQDGTKNLVQVADRDGWHLDLPNTPARPGDTSTRVVVINIVRFTESLAEDHWDAVKLNCEGAEYDILQTWPGPIARQICVSFHEHTGAHTGKDLESILKHLAQWYTLVQHPYDERYSAGFNHWDSLWILR